MARCGTPSALGSLGTGCYDSPMQLRLHVEPDETGGYVVHVPALRGCWSQGETRDEAVANIREAVELWLESQHEMAAAFTQPAQIEMVTL